MKAVLFHFMNALRIPIMFATKLLMWFMALGMFFAIAIHFGWVESTPPPGHPLFMFAVIAFIWAGLYYFRWKYDVILVLLKPKSVNVAVSQGDIHIIGKG